MKVTQAMRGRMADVIATIARLTKPEPGCKSCARQQRACRKHAEARLAKEAS